MIDKGFRSILGVMVVADEIDGFLVRADIPELEKIVGSAHGQQEHTTIGITMPRKGRLDKGEEEM